MTPQNLARFPSLGEEEQEFTSVIKGSVGPGEVIPVAINNAM